MNITRKLILIGICFTIIIIVFAVNVMHKVREDKQGEVSDNSASTNIITRAEAYRLLSYLEYDKADREALPLGITYAKKQMSNWYDSYVNAIWKMGLIEGNVTIAPSEPLSYAECKKLVDNLIIKNPEYQKVYSSLSFDFGKNADMKISEFLELYQAILAVIPKEKSILKEETLFVLGKEVTEDGIDRMVTDQGKYYYLDAKDYTEYLDSGEATEITGEAQDISKGATDITGQVTDTAKDAADTNKQTDITKEAADTANETTDTANETTDTTNATTDTADETADIAKDAADTSKGTNINGEAIDGAKEATEITVGADSTGGAAEITEKVTENEKTTEEDGTSSDKTSDKTSNTKDTSFVNQYVDKVIHVLTCGQEIIYITSTSTEKVVLHNVWIISGMDATVNTFVNGLNKDFTTEYKLSSSIEKVIGDITIENQKIVQISVKPDMIQGKVLRSGDDFIEIEGYGKVPLEEGYKIYKIYGTLSMEPTGSILVGYENTDFIVSKGKISAALITENIKAENIRVLLRDSDYKDMYHKDVKFTATKDFTVSTKESEKEYKAGDTVTIEQDDKLFKEGRITVKTVSGEGKIQILSLERSYGNPKYRGSIEIAKDDSGLLLINELPLEEYLYAVIPSEMPTSYGEEALKVQAICARSYAYKHLMANSLSQYGAHVDDSVTYQVYNNKAENEDSILAVKDTYGKVVEYNGDVISTLYFSTSCGHTADAASAWSSEVEQPYLEGKLLLLQEEGDEQVEQEEIADQYDDLSTEDAFKSFITSTDLNTYDSGFSWYRWKVTMSVKDIKKVIDSNLENRYQANPDKILTKTSGSGEGKDADFESIPIDTVGTIVDISVVKRDSSGMLSEILITGSKNTIKVKSEYNIRALLAPVYDTITRQDDSKVENFNLLPSAFFAIDKKEKSSKLSSITLTGGGYGHGVGLSQNGVKAMVEAGKDYEDIIEYFYEGTELGYIYE